MVYIINCQDYNSTMVHSQLIHNMFSMDGVLVGGRSQNVGSWKLVKA